MYLKIFVPISNINLNIIYEFNHINLLIIQTGNARTKNVTKYKKEITILICLFVMIIRLCHFGTITVHTNLHILYYTFHTYFNNFIISYIQYTLCIMIYCQIES